MSHAARRRLLVAGAALVALPVLPAWLGGCALLPRDATVPMPTLRIGGACATAAAARPAPVLLVLLPGAYSLPTEFVDEGFVAALHQSKVDADVLIADSHLGYFGNGSFEQRLREDVIEPARRQGYRRIWLVGISLGGFGALAYAATSAATQGSRSPLGVEGVFAIAPYLGGRRLLSEIEAAGGAAAWAALQAPVQGGRVPAFGEAGASDDAVRSIWRWLGWQAQSQAHAHAQAHAQAQGQAQGQAQPVPIYLGFGTEDRLAPGHRLMAGLLPADHVFRTGGDHDWPAWRDVWRRWLALGLLPAAAADTCATAVPPPG